MLNAMLSTLRNVLVSWTDRARAMRLKTVRLELRMDRGFHGDRYLLELADHFLRGAGAMIETGTFVGTTALYVGRRYPQVRVYSCEPDRSLWNLAIRRCRGCPNVVIEHSASPAFVHGLLTRFPELLRHQLVFWLDAHGQGVAWPLREEITFITSRLDSGVMMIDDFKVPGRPEFGFDHYDGQDCSLEYIRSAFHPGRRYTLILPIYGERTSPWHGLRGVGTFVWNRTGKPFALPETLRASFREGPFET